MLDATLTAWLRLTSIVGLGNLTLRRLLQVFGSPEAILLAAPAELAQHVRSEHIAAILAAGKQSIPHEIESWLSQPGHHILTLADANYPQALLNIHDPPLLLYALGNLALLNSPSIAIVGSRNATPQGLRNAEAFARALSDAGLCVISGMALGIDGAAHWGALYGQGSSVAVIGTGIDRIYPAAHKKLAHLLATHGCIISEFPLGTPPLASNFPRRNRIISGMSLGCLVVEASLQSGSLITARSALEHGREVFAIPGSIHAPQAKGCHALIKQGAKLVESVSDILEELSLPAAAVTATPPIVSDNELGELREYLTHEPIDIDTLALRSGLTVETLSSILLQLELAGKIAALPGGFYQRIQ